MKQWRTTTNVLFHHRPQPWRCSFIVTISQLDRICKSRFQKTYIHQLYQPVFGLLTWPNDEFTTQIDFADRRREIKRSIRSPNLFNTKISNVNFALFSIYYYPTIVSHCDCCDTITCQNMCEIWTYLYWTFFLRRGKINNIAFFTSGLCSSMIGLAWGCSRCS